MSLYLAMKKREDENNESIHCDVFWKPRIIEFYFYIFSFIILKLVPCMVSALP